MKKLFRQLLNSILFFITPLIVMAHPGHGEGSTHSFLHFEHLFVVLTIVFFIVINKLIKSYLEIEIENK